VLGLHRHVEVSTDTHTYPVPLIAANPVQRGPRQVSSLLDPVGTRSALEVGRGDRTIERPGGRG
jgi:hypothetical protein